MVILIKMAQFGKNRFILCNVMHNNVDYLRLAKFNAISSQPTLWDTTNDNSESEELACRYMQVN